MANRKEKTTQLQITVVIGTLNRPKIVYKLLNQLFEDQQHFIEVFVFDQSHDEYYRQLLAIFPKKPHFTLFHLNKPNTCRYLNLGWQKASTPIVLYLDDDVDITEQTIQEHIYAYKNPKIHAVAGRVINENENIPKNSKVGKINWFGAEIIQNFSSDQQVYVDFPYGCNMSFRKTTLEEFHGFDENLSPPIYSYNEVDIGFRVSKKYPNSFLFAPKALVYHKRYSLGGTRNFDLEIVHASNWYNYGYFLAKNFSLLENIICFLRRLPYQLVKEPENIKHIKEGYMSYKKFLYNH